jgi:hypothetical protein
MANPKGRPKVKNKYAWIVTPDGVQAVPVRMHQGVYKTFHYDKEKQRTTFGKEIKSPVFDSLEEANKNAPKFIGYQEDMRGLQGKGSDMFYKAKYGYEINADNELAVVEYRYNPASGGRAEGYRRYIYYEDGFQTPGRLAPGELWDTPDAVIDDYQTNYSGGKKIDWDAFDESQADMAAREPSQAELDRAYPNYDEYYDPGPRPTPGNIVMGPDGPYEETVQDAADWDYEQELLREEADAEDRRLDMQAEEERLRAAGDLEYGNPDLDNPLDDFDGPAYDAQTMDADTPIDTSSRNSRFPMRPESIDPNISNSLAKNMNVEPSVMKRILGVGMKLLPFIDEEILIAGPATLASKALRAGGFVKTAAGVTAGAGAIAAYETYWMIANLGMAALNQIRSEAKEPGGVPEMLFSEDVSTDNKEQFFNDLDRYLKGSIAMNVWKYGISRPMGYDDPIDVIKRMVGK